MTTEIRWIQDPDLVYTYPDTSRNENFISFLKIERKKPLPLVSNLMTSSVLLVVVSDNPAT